MMVQFFETQMGRKFFEHDIPKLLSLAERIANGLEKKQLYVPSVAPSGGAAAYEAGRLQPTIEVIRESCDFAEGSRLIPGLAFPIDNGPRESDFASIDGRVFIARDDAAGIFDSDIAAANFVALLIGKPWKKFFDQEGKDYYFPYFEIDLVEADEIHYRFGARKQEQNNGR